MVCLHNLQFSTCVCRQLERLKIEYPDKQVVIVTFASDVQVYDNGRAVCTINSSADLSNYDSLIESGRDLANRLHVPAISAAYE